ncbi:methyl-accepting chemotaxis protein [Metapseudomonas lalkuanensis]|uniref:Methyl-accepting chemotaxis protein n=1 Tax=Metapseudomonas lalkuanensis TaxID=2604832 RepID=A0A5J6QMC2_9GAMM|nr:methyl-accepting chemotaxis protein [Pseudomonas lalkuanensis]QEY62421.1 methyl-accepting chemotaxis protein [Pseudomonas lalkuanensis]
MFLRQFPIAYRAAFGFAIITLMLVGLGGFAHNRMTAINKASTEISEFWLPSVQASGQMGLLMATFRLSEMNHVLAQDSDTMNAQERRMDMLLAELAKVETAYQSLLQLPEEKQLFEEVLSASRDYMNSHEALLQLSRRNDTERAYALMRGEQYQRYENLSRNLAALIDLDQRQAGESSRRGDEVVKDATRSVVLVMVLAVLASIAIAWLLTQSIVGPIREAMRTAERVAGGDLTGEPDSSGRDEPARLMQALQSMRQYLRGTIEQIGHSATQLASAAEELYAVTEEGNRSLNRQHDEIEMAATAVNQMSAAVEEVARNAASTSEASTTSEGVALSGREQVEETVQAIRGMGEEVTRSTQMVADLAGQAQGIATVLDVIRSIAEQTNLLALNAAIEAARAGEQGRGFAVVADEVRALAHRTQESTREIEQMIAAIQAGSDAAVSAMNKSDTHAQDMVKLAESAGQALQDIARRAGEINERTLVIATAAEQQAQVAREVDRNLVNIRDISVQTSAGANQTAAATHELSRLAVELNGMIARFVV